MGRISLTPILAILWIALVSGENRFVCEHSEFVIQCPPGETIFINSANYGRRDMHTCPHEQILTDDCSHLNAEEKIRTECEYQNSCNFHVNNNYFGHDPCLNTYKYAEIDYTCRSIPQARQLRGTERVQICEHDHATISCPQGEGISIMRANYGRTDGASICPHSMIITTECTLSSAKATVMTTCENQNTCTFPVSNTHFENDPCLGTFKYLEVDYRCRRIRPPKVPRGVHRTEVCEHGTVTLSCPEGEVINLYNADYGRSNGPQTCPHDQILTTNCHLESAAAKVREHCDGHNSCHFPATNAWFGEDPCYLTYKYATVDYRCRARRVRPTRHSTAICQFEEETLSCPVGQEIQIKKTTYGRQNRRECASHDPEQNVSRCNLEGAGQHVKDLCNRQNSCTIHANNNFFNADDAFCHGTRTYANVKYMCKTPAKAKKNAQPSRR